MRFAAVGQATTSTPASFCSSSAIGHSSVPSFKVRSNAPMVNQEQVTLRRRHVADAGNLKPDQSLRLAAGSVSLAFVTYRTPCAHFSP